MSAPPRPRIHLLRGDDPEKFIDDPGLGALASAGWTIGGILPVQVDAAGGNREPRLLLILWPPPSRRARIDWSHVVVAIASAVSAIATITVALGTWAIAHGLHS